MNHSAKSDWNSFSSAAFENGLGLAADAPAGRLSVRPMRPAPFGDLRVRGEPVEVDVDDDGSVSDVRAPAWLEVDVS